MRKIERPVRCGMAIRTELGSFIRKRRIKFDLRQAPLAKQCGVAQTVISNLEIGTRKYLDDKKLKKLAMALRCSENALRRRMPVKPGIEATTELGKLIRSRREELGMAMEMFAQKMKMSLLQAKYLEVRRSHYLRYSLVEPVAKALNIDPSILALYTTRSRRETKSELGKLVRTRRKELGMSSGAIAQKLNVSRQYVTQIELGQVRLSENDEMIAHLSKVLGIDVKTMEAVRPERRLKSTNTTKGMGGFFFARRFELHLTQSEVAERAKMSTATISGYEKGRILPSVEAVKKLEKALGCHVPSEMRSP